METVKNQIIFETENLTDVEAAKRLAAIQIVVDESRLVTDNRHVFRLTPDRLILNQEAKIQFEQIGDLILSSFQATRQVFLRAKRGDFAGDLNRFIVSALEAGITKAHRRTLESTNNQLPLFFRADCVLAKTANGLAVKTTEIEGERSIAFGFASLIDQLNTAINATSNDPLFSGVGVGEGINRAIRQSQFDGSRIGLILGADQQFYLPEQQLFVDTLFNQGLPVELVQEEDLAIPVGNTCCIKLSDGQTTNTAVSLPIFNPQKSNKIYEPERLRLGFVKNEFNFLLPPFKFFGTKSPMALMRQPMIRELFIEEGVNGNFIDAFIPPTRIIAGQISEVERLLLEMGVQTEPPTFLKAVGMTAGRGMALPDDKEGINDILRIAAKGKPFEYITQQFLTTAAPPFRILDQKTGNLVIEPQFMRLAAFFVNIEGQATLLGVEGTGLPDPFVHGNPNCIFFPVVFKED